MVDFHIHTDRYGGDLSAKDIFEEIQKKPISIFSITDHEEITELPKSLNEMSIQPLYIKGIEFTCTPNDIHMLGYFPQYVSEEVKNLIERIKSRRIMELVLSIRLLKKAGILVSANDIIKKYHSISYLDINKYIVSLGLADNVNQAIERFFLKGKIAYFSRWYPGVKDTIHAIKRSKGIAILAHPLRDNRYKDIEICIKNGIDGLEVYHPVHNGTHIKRLLLICKEKNLLVSGGSDYHYIIDKLGYYANGKKIVRSLVNCFVERLINEKNNLNE